MLGVFSEANSLRRDERLISNGRALRTCSAGIPSEYLMCAIFQRERRFSARTTSGVCRTTSLEFRPLSLDGNSNVLVRNKTVEPIQDCRMNRPPASEAA